MKDAIWNLAESRAQFTAGKLAASVDISRPGRGLTDLRVGHEKLPGGLLQVLLPGGADVESPLESYIRGGDLVVDYPQTDARPFRPQVYWRSLAAPHLTALAAIETIASTQTSLLDSQPRVTVRTELPAVELWRLSNVERAEFKQISLSSAEPQQVHYTHGPGCYLWRLSGQRLSFAEMVPPSDFHCTDIVTDSAGLTSLSHRLFERWLEKGVILRARVRGVFLERGRDATCAIEWYRDLLASELPLTT